MNALHVAIVIPLLMFAGCVPSGYERADAKHERRLQPAIEYIDKYIEVNNSLPTQREFQDWADSVDAHMLVIRDRSNPYAAGQGATSQNDYMVGTWRADWYHYYKSWDRKYLNASDEPPTGYSLD